MRRSRVTVLLGVLGLLGAACGGSNSDSSGTSAASATTAAATTAGATTAAATTAGATTAAATTAGATTAAATTAAATTAGATTAGCTLAKQGATAPAGVDVDSLLKRGRVSIAHDGGHLEAPGDTVFAYRDALANSADVLDMNLFVSKDGQLVLAYDPMVDQMTDKKGKVGDYTAAELAAMDAAYWWIPGIGTVQRDRPDSAYVCRGVRTGAKPAPAGTTAADFGIPTFQQVVDAFPNAVFSVELRDESGPTIVPAVVKAIKDNQLEKRVVVGSTNAEFMTAFVKAMPGVAASPGLGTLLVFRAKPAPLPDYRIAQVPPKYGTITVTQQDLDNLKANNLPIWIFPNDDALETAAAYEGFLKQGANGVNAARPSVMASVKTG